MTISAFKLIINVHINEANEMTKSKLNIITATAVTLGLSLALLTAPVSAAKKGPRASLSAATVCDISRDEFTGIVNSTEFNVTIKLTDKTSGSGTPVVTAWNVKALAKTGRGNWDNQVMFDSASGGPEADLSDIVVAFDLCKLGSDAKAVNAAASITYEINSGGDPRTIENMCSDDPATEEVEPAGIKLSPADLDAISNYICPQ